MSRAVEIRRGAPLIPDDEPFANDRMERKRSVGAICDLLERVVTPVTIGLIGPWGSGKSYVARQVEVAMRSRLRPSVVRIDAWAQSHALDPLPALLSAILVAVRGRYAPGQKSTIDDQVTVLSNLLDRFSAFADFVGSVAKLGNQVAPGLIPDGSAEVVTATASAAKSARKVTSKKPAAPPTISEFRHALSALMDLMAQEQSGSAAIPPAEARTAQVVVIVDELDRCPPRFALNLFERLEHVCDVEGAAFVLVYDEKALQSAVQVVHGPSINAADYLRRFIHLPIAVVASLRNLVADRLAFVRLGRESTDFLAKVLRDCSRSARDVDNLATTMRIVGELSQYNEPTRVLLVLCMIAAQVNFPDVLRFANGGPPTLVFGALGGTEPESTAALVPFQRAVNFLDSEQNPALLPSLGQSAINLVQSISSDLGQRANFELRKILRVVFELIEPV